MNQHLIVPNLEKDDLFNEAARIVVQHQSGSQIAYSRKLRLGYNEQEELLISLNQLK